MNPSSPYGYLPYTSNSQVTSPGVQTQQPLSPQQHHHQQQQQQQLGNVTQDLNQDLSTPSTPLSLHPSSSVSGSSASPIGVRNSVPTLSSHGHPTINTAMLSNSFGGMLPSPQQSSQVPSTPTGTTALPTTPPQTADLDTILATYSNQPELLKLIIASKTEEDRRWAEEARFKMMDLIMRGENRGVALMTGYESLLSQVVPGTGTATTTTTTASAIGTPVSSVSSGNISTSTSPSTSTAATTPVTIPSSTIATGNLALTPSGKRFMDDEFDAYSGTGGGGENNSGGVGGFGQGPDHGLSRKRSVTFARDVNQGHLRSQSMSSVPTLSNSVSSAANSADSFGTLSMLGLTGPNTALQQHHQQQLHQVQHPSMHQLPPLSLQPQYQQQHSQFQQQHQQASHQAAHQLPPQFGQYPQVFQYHVMPQLHHQGVIRRTNSLSHLSHLTHSQHTTVTEPRLVAGRPRNDSASSLRTLDDDSDDESDEEYADNHVLGGLNSRPGSSLSMNNMVGGNGETTLTLDFSDMASVSGPTVYTQQQQHPHQQGQVQSQGQNQGQHNNSASSTSIMSSLHGQGALVPMGMSGMGTSAGMRGIPANTTGSTAAAAAAAAAAADPKRKRKRREMQPVNKIVESNEPIVDQYLWKNNGNTTQKKTGCKSVYYKCSNSPGGCTVNKTVTEKEGGGYITKYRGEHLDDCIKFKRAQLAAQAQAAHHAYSLREQ
ncbi:hypothetical protein BGX26_008399 [Mortierella sp. AD094]|nr:hypothetical protein BGX26_008399 [Mortierella sp. AD094]